MNVDVSRKIEGSPYHHRRMYDSDTGTDTSTTSHAEGSVRDSSLERTHGRALKKRRGGENMSTATSSNSLLFLVMGTIVGMFILAGLGVSFYLTHVKHMEGIAVNGREGTRGNGDAVLFHRQFSTQLLKKLDKDYLVGKEKQLRDKEPHMLNIPEGAVDVHDAGGNIGGGTCVTCMCVF